MAPSGADRTYPAPPAELRDLYDVLHRPAGAALRRVWAALQAACRPASMEGEVALTGAVATHRRDHRPGKPSRIDGNPELRASVVARIHGMAFTALADAIRDRVPPGRRVEKERPAHMAAPARPTPKLSPPRSPSGHRRGQPGSSGSNPVKS